MAFWALVVGEITLECVRQTALDARQTYKGRMTVSEFEVVGKVADFEDNVGQAVPVDGRMVAVFRKGDQWYAIDDLCPHMGASLAEGHVEDHSVTCPWHAWRFCIKDGTWEDNPRVKVDSFEVKIDGDDVLVREIPKVDAKEDENED
ncbi:Assimilatory nitrite reductase [NAD(P)H] small subunit [Rubripirellula lacrimiformis]|uniref:Assimilatory nitrite reductase [NAD(P)H] small subunit n=1 Tax=Rubripirellula lacrimiformis TaxID=1930273 RepID=A0A517N691_9BACT|nr:Assimilatory nitrite reductase [NAD(P)H] small subunit [Rubripirellula lacrimiformis]